MKRGQRFWWKGKEYTKVKKTVLYDGYETAHKYNAGVVMSVLVKQPSGLLVHVPKGARVTVEEV